MIPESLFKCVYVAFRVVCVVHVLIVALYTISLLMHLFCSGHVSLFLQLQLAVLVTCGWLFLIIYACIMF